MHHSDVLNRPILDNSTIIHRFKIVKLLGRGGYGDVYLVNDIISGIQYALKTEYLQSTRTAMTTELEICGKIRGSSFTQVVSVGNTSSIRYYAMKLCGFSLTTFRKTKIFKLLKANILIQIAIETFKTIQKFHNFGYVHRDIKPSNFLFQKVHHRPICLIDYGLSCRHIDELTHQPFPKGSGKFIGTSKYVSLNVHHHISYGRRDDLMSWFYSMVEIGTGSLPWKKERDRNAIEKCKSEITVFNLCEKLPHSFLKIYHIIKYMDYEECPQYDKILLILRNTLNEVTESDSLPWSMFLQMIFEESDKITFEDCN